ncbi:OsmC family protein [Streptococcus sp. CSL10205-OR2]|uniref:OsmC family protein n=1 Tax=Streptococcus sp. CSL10205-OR2 TaxID=2980558 RepID=UPI0021D9C281|nr:OsmC family protein [Streptococcus sp. CSL10205-OR2]MCU9534060.1 OsmC family protein [Streptococcus sp. CSL10205-OR2]
MYQTKIIGDRLFHVKSEGYGDSVELFGVKQQGETPMSLVNIALGSCITMCVQGYFKKHHHLNEVPIEVSSSYEDDHFSLTVAIHHPYNQEESGAILAYIDDYCRVKKLLRDDVKVDISLLKTAE